MRSALTSGYVIFVCELSCFATPFVSAHVMGGCPLGPDLAYSAVDTSGRYHHLANLHVFDGSLFPTSIGANPQMSIYGIVARLATDLATALSPRGRPDGDRARAPGSD